MITYSPLGLAKRQRGPDRKHKNRERQIFSELNTYCDFKYLFFNQMSRSYK